MAHRFFDDDGFDGQFLRTLAEAPWFQAEIGECFATATLITNGDEESWYQEWTSIARQVHERAEEALANGHHRTALDERRTPGAGPLTPPVRAPPLLRFQVSEYHAVVVKGGR